MPFIPPTTWGAEGERENSARHPPSQKQKQEAEKQKVALSRYASLVFCKDVPPQVEEKCHWMQSVQQKFEQHKTSGQTAVATTLLVSFENP